MKKLIKSCLAFAESWPGTIIIVLGVIFFIAQAFVIPSGSMKNTMLIGDNLFVKKFAYGIPTPVIPWIDLQVLPDFHNNGHLFEGEKPKRGDIVIFRYPKEPSLHFVKRNVGIQDDEIIYTKDGLYIHFSTNNPYNQSSQSITYQSKRYWYDPYMAKHPGIHYEKDQDAFLILERFSQNGANIAMQPITLENGERAFYYKVPKGHFFMMGDNRNNSDDSRFWGSVEYRYIIGKPWFIYLSWDDDFQIRWNRIGKSIEALEEQQRYE